MLLGSLITQAQKDEMEFADVDDGDIFKNNKLNQ